VYRQQSQHDAVKSPRFACLIGQSSARISCLATILETPDLRTLKGRNMKRSRRVVLTLMGSAAVSAVSMGFVRRGCGPGLEAVPGQNGRPYCRAVYGGFGAGPHRFHGLGHGGGHGHGHGGG
jgi:hypothetical protein